MCFTKGEKIFKNYPEYIKKLFFKIMNINLYFSLLDNFDNW